VLGAALRSGAGDADRADGTGDGYADGTGAAVAGPGVGDVTGAAVAGAGVSEGTGAGAALAGPAGVAEDAATGAALAIADGWPAARGAAAWWAGLPAGCEDAASASPVPPPIRTTTAGIPNPSACTRVNLIATSSSGLPGAGRQQWYRWHARPVACRAGYLAIDGDFGPD
jgi:hypothetical protein